LALESFKDEESSLFGGATSHELHDELYFSSLWGGLCGALRRLYSGGGSSKRRGLAISVVNLTHKLWRAADQQAYYEGEFCTLLMDIPSFHIDLTFAALRTK
jgi:hypothetical protein